MISRTSARIVAESCTDHAPAVSSLHLGPITGTWQNTVERRRGGLGRCAPQPVSRNALGAARGGRSPRVVAPIGKRSASKKSLSGSQKQSFVHRFHAVCMRCLDNLVLGAHHEIMCEDSAPATAQRHGVRLRKACRRSSWQPLCMCKLG